MNADAKLHFYSNRYFCIHHLTDIVIEKCMDRCEKSNTCNFVIVTVRNYDADCSC